MIQHFRKTLHSHLLSLPFPCYFFPKQRACSQASLSQQKVENGSHSTNLIPGIHTTL